MALPMTQAHQKAQQLQNRLQKLNPELKQSASKAKKPPVQENSRPPTQTPGSKIQKKPLDFTKDNNELVKEYYQKQVKEIEERLDKEAQEFERLNQDMKRRQERYIRREQEYRKTIEQLQQDLNPNRKQDSTNVWEKSYEYVQSLHSKIKENIETIQSKVEKIINEQEKDHKRVFNAKLAEIKKDLEEERRRKGVDQGNFAEKENKLIRQLDLINSTLEVIGNKNIQLYTENQKLRQDFKQQENDRELLIRQIVVKKKENAELREEKTRLQEILTQQTFGDNIPHTAPKPPLERELSLETDRSRNVISKLKNQLDGEKRKTSKIQGQFLRELSGRTELETLLRQCVEEVKQEISRKRTGRSSVSSQGFRKEQEFQLNTQDRERIIELLLSQERVLTLLYDKTFPPREKQEREESTQQQLQSSSLKGLDENLQSLAEQYEQSQQQLSQQLQSSID